MHLEKAYYIYIMSNRSKTIYVGVTGHLRTPIWQHKTGQIEGFTKKYKLDRLVYLEKYKYVRNAFSREKQLKRGRELRRFS
jgi:putative endonuclease